MVPLTGGSYLGQGLERVATPHLTPFSEWNDRRENTASGDGWAAGQESRLPNDDQVEAMLHPLRKSIGGRPRTVRRAIAHKARVTSLRHWAERV